MFIILLGLVQGFTEFLPISSSGHLAMFENLPYFSAMKTQIESQFPLLAFNVILHLGTILAVIIFWRNDIIEIISNFFSDLLQKDFRGAGFRTGLLILTAISPLLVVPFIKHLVEEATSNMAWISTFFIANGLLLITSDYLFHKRWHKRSAAKAKEGQDAPLKLRKIEELSYKDSLIVGLFQGLAIFPGISRSGSTITASLMRGLSGPEAVKFSFILSIPVLTAAAALEIYEIRSSIPDIAALKWDWVIAGLTAAFLSGILSLKILVWLGKRVIFYPFGIYTIILGATLALLY